MTDLTPHAIVETLSRIGRELDEKSTEIETLDFEATRLRADYKRMFARAFLTAQGSNDVRRYTAESETADLLLEAETADQVLRAGKEQLRVLRDRLEIGRSLGSIMKMEWGNS